MHHWLFLAQRPVNRYSEAKIALQRLYPGQNSWYQQIYPPPKESKRSPNYSLDPAHPFVKKNYPLSPLDKTRSWIYQTIAVHPTRNLGFSRRGHVSSCCKIKFDTCNRHCKLNSSHNALLWNRQDEKVYERLNRCARRFSSFPPIYCSTQILTLILILVVINRSWADRHKDTSFLQNMLWHPFAHPPFCLPPLIRFGSVLWNNFRNETWYVRGVSG